jgi:hypothetical protein
MILKIFSPKNWRLGLKTKLNYSKIWHWVLRKTTIFSPKIVENRRKFITSTPDWANFCLLADCLLWAVFFKRGCPGWGANPGPLDFIYFLIFTTLPLSHSGSPTWAVFYKLQKPLYLGYLITR